MTREEIEALVGDDNPEALFLDGFDDAFVGVIRRCGQPTLVCYEYNACIEVLERQGMSWDEAVEFFEFNTVGAWVGENTPCILVLPDEE